MSVDTSGRIPALREITRSCLGGKADRPLDNLQQAEHPLLVPVSSARSVTEATEGGSRVTGAHGTNGVIIGVMAIGPAGRLLAPVQRARTSGGTHGDPGGERKV